MRLRRNRLRRAPPPCLYKYCCLDLLDGKLARALASVPDAWNVFLGTIVSTTFVIMDFNLALDALSMDPLAVMIAGLHP
jgi:hypothetical protein